MNTATSQNCKRMNMFMYNVIEKMQAILERSINEIEIDPGTSIKWIQMNRSLETYNQIMVHLEAYCKHVTKILDGIQIPPSETE